MRSARSTGCRRRSGFDLLNGSASVESSLAPLRSTLKDAVNSSTIASWFERITAGVTVPTRDAMLPSVGEATLKQLTPLRTYAETLLATGEFASITSRYSAVRSSFLDDIWRFLDDVSASEAPGSEQEPSAALATETSELASPDSVSNEQVARGGFILLVALLFVAAFLTSGSVAEQLVGGVDPFKALRQ
jgi:hypothetical protein